MNLRICSIVLGALACLGDSISLRPQTASAQSSPRKTDTDSIVKQFLDECVRISPGTDPFPSAFQMGGPGGGPFTLPVKEVSMDRSFRISKYEVTQELYQAVMGINPSRWKGARNSVEMVSCQDAEQFCIRLTAVLRAKMLLKDDEQVRLPSESEWEYCCRAATTTRFSFGDSATAEGDAENQATVLSEFAWHTGNAAGNDPVVGSLKPNPWGLYDMHGYLWEYVADPFNATATNALTAGASTDTTTPAASSARIIRGGSWRDHHSLLTSDFRLTLPAYAASDAIGFRCVISEQGD